MVVVQSPPLLCRPQQLRSPSLQLKNDVDEQREGHVAKVPSSCSRSEQWATLQWFACLSCWDFIVSFHSCKDRDTRPRDQLTARTLRCPASIWWVSAAWSAERAPHWQPPASPATPRTTQQTSVKPLQGPRTKEPLDGCLNDWAGQWRMSPKLPPRGHAELGCSQAQGRSEQPELTCTIITSNCLSATAPES